MVVHRAVNMARLMNAAVTEHRLLEALKQAVARAPVVRRVSARRMKRGDDRAPDALLDVAADGAAWRWLVQLKATPVEPRSAEALASELQGWLAAGLGEYGIVVAPYVSPRSAEILARAGVGFVDLSGNCSIATGPLYIERVGFPNASKRKAGLRSLFTPGAERVLRAVLDPATQGRAWTLRELATAAFPGVSLGQAHRVAKLLEDQVHVRRESKGLVVLEPAKLLHAWAGAYRPDRSRATRCYSPLAPGDLRARLGAVNRQAQDGEGGVLASFSAGEVLAPAVRQHRFFAYWRGDLSRLPRALELKPVDSGENVVILEPYDDGVLYPFDHEGEAVTCPVQTYLDLRGSAARGEEAAEAVFDRYLARAYAS